LGQAPFVLTAFEDLSNILELQQLTLRLLEFLFLLGEAVAQAVNLVEHHFDRGFLFPRFPRFLTCRC